MLSWQKTVQLSGRWLRTRNSAFLKKKQLSSVWQWMSIVNKIGIQRAGDTRNTMRASSAFLDENCGYWFLSVFNHLYYGFIRREDEITRPSRTIEYP